MKKEERIQWLDALRGLAILLVILFHFTVRFGEKYPDITFHSSPILSVKFGWLGVYLFFMISGYIIYLTIQKKKGLLDFLIARLSRLIPPYWTAIILILFLETLHSRLFGIPNRNDLISTLFNIAMIPDLFHARYLDGVFWSLFVEIKFYLLFGILWKWFGMRGKKNFFVSFLILEAASLTFNLLHPFPFGENLNYFLFFWLGIAIFKYLKENLTLIEYLTILALTTISTKGFYHDGPELLIGTPVFSFLFILLERLFSRYPIQTVRLFFPIIWIGRISYSYYLVHQPIGYLILGVLAVESFSYNISIVTAILVCTGVAFIGYRFIERLDKPIALFFKNRFISDEKAVNLS